MANVITAKDLLKTEGIITAFPGQTLSQALTKLQSSHDAVFVTDKKNNLLGVISPYHVLYHSNLPAMTKLENCLFSPPKLRENSPVWEIAKNMLEAKVYYLPVLSQNGKWLGIVSVKTLLRTVAQDPNFVNNINIPRKAKIITIKEDSSLGEVRSLLSNKGVSRLPVVNANGRLIGILTRYDLRRAFSQPKSSQSFLSRVGEKKKFSDQPIRSYFKKNVITASENTNPGKMINQMLENEIGSIILVNSKWQPVNILSYRDLLKAISEFGRSREADIVVKTPEGFDQRSLFTGMLNKLIRKLVKLNRATRIEAIMEGERNAANRFSRFRVTIIASHPDHGKYIGEATDFNWKTAVNKAIEKVETQVRKTKD